MHFVGFLKRHRNDLLLILGILLLSGALALVLFFVKKPGAYAEVRIGNKLTGLYPLSEDADIRLETEDGEYNRLIIENGEAFISEASCRDLICVNRGKVSSIGDTIVCLPHRLVVTVVSEDSGGTE